MRRYDDCNLGPDLICDSLDVHISQAPLLSRLRIKLKDAACTRESSQSRPITKVLHTSSHVHVIQHDIPAPRQVSSRRRCNLGRRKRSACCLSDGRHLRLRRVASRHSARRRAGLRSRSNLGRSTCSLGFRSLGGGARYSWDSRRDSLRRLY